MFLYQVQQITTLAPDISQITLSSHTPLTYDAGQYVEVYQENQSIPLSIANAPEANQQLEFQLMHTTHNMAALQLLKQKTWQLQGPYGTCTFSKLKKNLPIIFLARGTGFAPIKAIMERFISARLFPSCYFYWSVPTETQLYLQSLLQHWQQILPTFVYKPIFTAQTGSHIPPTIILAEHPDLSNFQVYVSGPKPLVQTALADFMQRGLVRENFYSDVA